MILGLGIDSVEIERFEHWHTFLQSQLLKFFSKSETDYCLAVREKSAERFAARFAAKEALLKALMHLQPVKPLLLLTVAKKSNLIVENNATPKLKIDWPFFIENYFPMLKKEPETFISITHTKTIATVCIILTQKQLAC
jgi:phosphopantetheine--protein transferase-like protein